jgi:hypothetical protein
MPLPDSGRTLPVSHLMKLMPQPPVTGLCQDRFNELKPNILSSYA